MGMGLKVSLSESSLGLLLEAFSGATWKKLSLTGENGDNIQREQKEAEPGHWGWEESVKEFK